VFCSSRSEIPDPVPEGVCGWNGKFTVLDAHLNECPCVEVKCTNFGCAAVFRRSEREAHSAECPFLSVSCELCAHPVLRKDMTQHLDQSCPCYLVTCECGATLERRHVEEHLVGVCPEALVPCLYAEYGCADKVPRKQLTAHLSESEKHNTQLFMLRELASLRREAAAQHSVTLALFQGLCNDVAALRSNIIVMENERAVIMAPSEVSWTIQNMRDKVSSSQSILSPPFSVINVSGGTSKLCMQMRIEKASIGVYLQHAPAGQNTSNVDVSNWSITCLDPFMQKTLNSGTILAPSKCVGFGEIVTAATFLQASTSPYERPKPTTLQVRLVILKSAAMEPMKKLVLRSL